MANLDERLTMTDRICDAEGCERATPMRYCGMHYQRLRRLGTLEAPKPLRPGGRGTCVHPDCDARDCGQHGYCKKHWSRVKRYGSPDAVHKRAPKPGPTHPLWLGDDVGYSAVHRRLNLERGKAAVQRCEDCGGSASEWSYNYRDPDAKMSPAGAYSTDLAFYEPRCRSCHRRFDAARRQVESVHRDL